MEVIIMDIIFNLLGNFFEAFIIIWICLFVIDAFKNQRITTKNKIKLTWQLSLVGSVINTIVDLFLY